MINKVTLVGHLGQAPEVRTLESGRSVARLSVATNENYQDKAGQWQTVTEWHNIVIWGDAAERAVRQLKKGMLVYIEGKLTNRSWQDQEGNTRRVTEISCKLFRSLAGREQQAEAESNGAPVETTTAKTTTATEGDLPF